MTLPAAERKSALRRQIRAARAALTAQDRARASEGLAASVRRARALAGAGDTTLAFLPHASEPPVMAALEELHATGSRVLVPRVLPERRLEWVLWQPGEPLVRSPHVPLDEPSGPAASDLRPSLVLVPALGIGENGVRLGQGGGFYDTFLASLPASDSVLVAAVVYDDELALPDAPAEPWDAVLEWAVTPGGLWRRRPPQAAETRVAPGRCPRSTRWRLA
ncbi:5-formyltetrahydrofolate cyclo-ligase [Falsarthrobacter nasiphocae]|uniref:5-formyltetrahydrofolate cyclo-ligase n=1 Tax=Falsarthrobacter nasiphocae TaxID=189863 RepID=A0AAE3YH18_9MICC|nr:5-formyltetrahydrofolate cyclo-ligase [Falsarthrobacter nasiphocae]MDR6892577.1 5-formyltetrahydrofolate cyclo-ligase [Falsarthrobacter nasiphocae]